MTGHNHCVGSANRWVIKRVYFHWRFTAAWIWIRKAKRFSGFTFKHIILSLILLANVT